MKIIIGLTALCLFSNLVSCKDKKNSKNEAVPEPIESVPSADAANNEEAVAEETEVEANTLVSCEETNEDGSPYTCVRHQFIDAEGSVAEENGCFPSSSEFIGLHLEAATVAAQNLAYKITPAAPACILGDVELDSISEPEEGFGQELDGFVDGYEAGVIRGWGCAQESVRNIAVEVFAGGGPGEGTSLGIFPANQMSVDNADLVALRERCSHEVKTTFRFVITIDNYLEYVGQTLFINGIHPSGNADLNEQLENRIDFVF